MNQKPLMLVILDGWGYRQEEEYNAISHAETPTFDFLFSHYPHTLLKASGQSAGLPKGFIGNSEVGHKTIGAGRPIKEVATRVLEDIVAGSYKRITSLTETLQTLKLSKKLHIMGLLSDSGVHSHEEQFYATIKLADELGIKNIMIHPFLDGRDVPPRSAEVYLKRLDGVINQLGVGAIGSIAGRWYAMDRDGNWKRKEQCYEALTEKQPQKFVNWNDALSYYYAEGISDEFIPPTQFSDNSLVADGDGIIMLNFREDRARQLTATFVKKDFDKFPIKPLQLSFFISTTSYGQQLSTVVLYPTEVIRPTLKQLLSEAGRSIFSIAETEKYAHVTYFFGGGAERPFKGEDRVLIKSIPAKTYIEHPCMSANEITESVIYSLENNTHDFYLINYANADMVGHSGNFDATVKAVECVDRQLERLYEIVVKVMDGILIVTADHGNAELMYDKQFGQVHTAHTTNKVPFVLVKRELIDKPLKYSMKTIADIAPVILKEMNIKVPCEMYAR